MKSTVGLASLEEATAPKGEVLGFSSGFADPESAPRFKAGLD